jgi:predicted ABC-type ATPase
VSGTIVVLAGVNGAGKSSVAGETLRRSGSTYYNPDEATQRYRAEGLTEGEANAEAWQQGRRLLERAIAERLDFALETTLGGHTITALLFDAARQGVRIRMWYVGLASPELHIQRVKERWRRGGHDIPEEKIRQRWDASRENVIRLLPHLAELSMWDNSASVALHQGERPRPLRILAMRDGRIHFLCPLDGVPGWAKPIVAAAMERDRTARGG